MFQLSDKEVELLLSQNAIPSRMHLGGALPYVFTEQGVAGISGELTRNRAIEFSIANYANILHDPSSNYPCMDRRGIEGHQLVPVDSATVVAILNTKLSGKFIDHPAIGVLKLFVFFLGLVTQRVDKLGVKI